MTYQVQKVCWWHERLADWMIINPHRTLKEAAVEFNVTPTWVYTLKNSNAFQEYWLRRTHEASDANDANTLLAKTGALADIALDKLQEKLSSPIEVLPAPFLLEVADTALRRLGYGSKPAGATAIAGATANVTVNVGLVSAEQLSAAREKMKRLHGVEVTALSPVHNIPLMGEREELKEIQG